MLIKLIVAAVVGGVAWSLTGSGTATFWVLVIALVVAFVLEGALGGAGETVPPMISSTAITASRIPLAGWAANHWGSAGIWWVISMTAMARGIAMAGLWRAGRWKRRSV